MIELLFKRIKQNLKIKSFLGTSKNAVLTQIWAAMIYYMLLAYLKTQSKKNIPSTSSPKSLAQPFSIVSPYSTCFLSINTPCIN